MNSFHRILIGDARKMVDLGDSSVQLVVTSPPYPMIEMWDEVFSNQSAAVMDALAEGQANAAFEAMHQELDTTWTEVDRVVQPKGFACINIGDATRTIGGTFRLFPNHSRVIQTFLRLGFEMLPSIIWRKATNAPNKFMGSGMLPAGAYVTLEHEHILIFRKGGKPRFQTEEEKERRRASAFFWEERNQWFSDLWDLAPVRQSLKGAVSRERSAGFPFDLPYRLILMYSLYGDTVLDPFAGAGTTLEAAVAAGRNSIGREIEAALLPMIEASLQRGINTGRAKVEKRVSDHLAFLESSSETRGPARHLNHIHGFPVVTEQESRIRLFTPTSIEVRGDGFRASYSPWPSSKPEETRYPGAP